MEHTGPSRFGPYIVLEQIGAGGMGAVYRARDQRLERDVAIKVLHRHLEMAGARERFMREARAVSSLNHPNISTIFDIGEQDGDPYLVMELLHGESLKEHLDDGVEISQLELESIAMQATQALAAAHAKGIVHRDIKPANLFLVTGPTGEPQLKVLDFGLAKLESDRVLYGDSGLTRTGSTVGTVEYMSPEQARGEELDARSDLFSLGAVLYELATGDVPFRGATSAVVFAELLGSNPVPPRTANSRVSPGMDAIIRKLLEKKRENRIQSANELLAELRKVRTPSTSRVQPAHPVASAAAPAAAPATQNRPTPSRPAAQTGLQSAPNVKAAAARPTSADLPAAPRHDVPVNEPAARAIRSRPSSAARATTSYSVETRAASRTSVEVAAHRDDHEEQDGPPKSRIGLIIAVAAVLVLAAAGFYLFQHAGKPAPTTAFTGVLQVAGFENSTGDAVLQEVPPTALSILLGEMPNLQLVGYAPSANSVEPDAAENARSVGAEAYLTGNVTREEQRYRVHAEIIRAADGSKLAAEDVEAGSLAEMPDALTRLAIALRTHMGETPEQASGAVVPLSQEGSSSINALSSYGRGVAMLRLGLAPQAIDNFNHALAEDGGFTLARLGLAEALRISGAEVERAAALEPLKSAAAKGSPCLRAEVAYATAAPGGGMDAAQKWAAQCAGSASAQVALTRELLEAGRPGEAESAGAKALALAPHDREAVSAATEAMLAQDHYEAAGKEQARAAATKVSSPGLTLLAAYLRGDTDGETQAAAIAQGSPVWQDEWDYVTWLSNRGKLADAMRFGQAAAARAEAQTGVASAGRLMRARLAAGEAMAGHCEAAAVSPGEGQRAAFFASLAAAWCHRPPVDLSNVKDPALLAVARGAQAWGSGNATASLDTLQGVRPSLEAPLAAMLRGEIHLMQKQQVVAIGDYRAVITRRGQATLTGTLVYPAAYAGLATAYHTTGDEANSSNQQAQLKTLWKDADPREPLLHRAEK